MDIKDLPAGDKFPEEFNVIIEITKGSRNKYEYDKDLGVIKLDRTLSTSISYPYDYGFIPHTLSEDGDMLDVFVILENSVFPGCLVTARPVGVVHMTDDGEKDEKIIAVPAEDARHKHITDIAQLSPHLKSEVQHFLEHYKDLRNNNVKVIGWGDRKEAIKVMNESLEK